MATKKPVRKAISKKVRFEVFKRDSFQCQYCGKSAPEVILHCDHIKPVSKGGDNSILNLVTACFDCNSGKSDRELSDQSALAKQKKQLDELNQKREQLQMLHDYRESVTGIDEEKILYITDLINEEISPFTLNNIGISKIKKWIKKFEYQVVLDSVECAVRQYLQFDNEGEVIQESANKVMSMTPRICTIKSRGGDHHDKDAYYIRGIIRNRGFNFTDYKALKLIKEAIAAKGSPESLKELAKTAKNWTEFRDSINNFLEQQEFGQWLDQEI